MPGRISQQSWFGPSVMTPAPEATEESIRSVLRAVWNRPDHRRGYPRGPRSYAWFPVILAQEFATSPERNPKRRSA